MSTTSVEDSSPAQPTLILTEKQKRVLQFLCARTTTSPQMEIEMGPGGIGIAMNFNKRACGMDWYIMKYGVEQIRVAGKLDPTTIEVDFEKLKQSAGLASVEQAQLIWESIIELMHPSLLETTVPEPIEDALDSELDKYDGPHPPLVRQLYKAARRVEFAACEFELRTCRKQLKLAYENAAASGTSSGRCDESVEEANDRLLDAKASSARASSGETCKSILALIIWYIRGLLGQDLQKLEAWSARGDERQRPKILTTLEVDDQGNYTSTMLMDELPKLYRRLHNSALVRGDAYQDRLQLFMCLYDLKTALWRRFLQQGSDAQQALFLYADKAGLHDYAGYLNWKHRLSFRSSCLADLWLDHVCGYGPSTRVGTYNLIGRQIKTMTRLFGDGVLNFMNHDLEHRLLKYTICHDPFRFVGKTLEVLVGPMLRLRCEVSRSALTGNLDIESLEPLLDCDLSSESVRKMDTVVADIKSGKVAIPMSGYEHDKMYAKIELTGLNIQDAQDMGDDIGKEGSTSTSKAPSIMSKQSRTTLANDDAKSGGRSGAEGAVNTLSSTMAGTNDASSRGPEHSEDLTHFSASENRFDSTTSTSKAGTKKRKDGRGSVDATAKSLGKKRKVLE